VKHLNQGDTLLAASEGMQAASCVEEMLLDQSYRENVIESRRRLSSAGGRAAHKRTDEIKAAVIRESRSGRHTKASQVYAWARKDLS
jgi:hypothetical protein